MKAHYHAHKSSPFIPISGKMHSVHNLTTYVLRSILILSSHLRLDVPFIFPD
jgi:hypothetical protein